jgi:2-C-methyl-D-erythritol 2,4-cyclodiphosphate synthase
MKFRIGFGYDVHRLEKGGPLFIGGIEVPYEKGAAGHSDADVLIHAICDAMLGAAALGDIGNHFPDNDPGYHNIRSTLLLKECLRLIREKGYRTGNIDSTVVLQEPQISSHIPRMREKLTEILETDPENISIKATTEEKLGFTGQKEGIAAYAVALLYRE